MSILRFCILAFITLCISACTRTTVSTVTTVVVVKKHSDEVDLQSDLDAAHSAIRTLVPNVELEEEKTSVRPLSGYGERDTLEE